MEQDELDYEERGRGGEVLLLSGVVPLRHVDQADFGEHLRKEHARHAQHGPPAVDQLSLHEPPEVLRVLRQPQRVEPVVSRKAAAHFGDEEEEEEEEEEDEEEEDEEEEG